MSKSLSFEDKIAFFPVFANPSHMPPILHEYRVLKISVILVCMIVIFVFSGLFVIGRFQITAEKSENMIEEVFEFYTCLRVF